jgi:hypothetical protein
VPHVWHVDSHGYDPTEWSKNLYLIARRIFKSSTTRGVVGRDGTRDPGDPSPEVERPGSNFVEGPAGSTGMLGDGHEDRT